MILIWRVRKLSSRSVKSPGVCGFVGERTNETHNQPTLLASSGDDLQQLKVEVDAAGAHLRVLFTASLVAARLDLLDQALEIGHQFWGQLLHVHGTSA